MLGDAFELGQAEQTATAPWKFGHSIVQGYENNGSGVLDRRIPRLC